ncbi:hypothetical protein Sjap_015848 [Stephania japonica]|uniref:Pentatricopeptide repeat-containing protein n=1 Tax=Stephania japonica TaxID=461633 RepID=A0AAP0IJW1_9MAGN
MAAAVVMTPPPSPPIHSLSNTTTNPHYHHLLTLITHCTAMPQLKQIHANALRTLSPDHPSTLFLHSRLVHFSASTDLDYASRLLHHIDNPNSFIWNTVIRAHAWNPHRKIEAFRLYRKMLMDGRVKQDKHTFPLVLKALAYLSWLSEGMQVHAHVVKLGYASDVYINNSLVHFYVSCGRVYVGRKVFDEMPERSLVSWNVMIDGYVEVGEFETALWLFVELQEKELFAPDGFTMQTVVCACGGMSALSLGMWAHAYVLRKCVVGVVGDALLKNSLLDMYCKCGSLEMACQVFDSMQRRDVATWNSMIMGFAMHGKVEKALEAFETMREDEEIAPNSITFVSVLSACNHGGLVEEGRLYFDLMVSKYKIEPQLEHYGCMVDLLARAGLIDDALNLVADMHVKPDVVIWRSLWMLVASKM